MSAAAVWRFGATMFFIWGLWATYDVITDSFVLIDPVIDAGIMFGVTILFASVSFGMSRVFSQNRYRTWLELNKP